MQVLLYIYCMTKTKSTDLKSAVAEIISERKWYEPIGYSQAKAWSIVKRFNDDSLSIEMMIEIASKSGKFIIEPIKCSRLV